MANKAMRRAVMEPKLDAQLREQASKVYKAIGLEMPPERPEEAKFRQRSHGGSEVVPTFTPTPEGPKLNAVHGPLAKRQGMVMEADVVGFPVVGAGQRARSIRARDSTSRMDIQDDEYTQANTPYFYPRREKKRGGVRKRRRAQKLNPSTKIAAKMEIDNSSST